MQRENKQEARDILRAIELEVQAVKQQQAPAASMPALKIFNNVPDLEAVYHEMKPPVVNMRVEPTPVTNNLTVDMAPVAEAIDRLAAQIGSTPQPDTIVNLPEIKPTILVTNPPAQVTVMPEERQPEEKKSVTVRKNKDGSYTMDEQ
jgi:hypothetical protein